MAHKLSIRDVTLRDGQQSSFATRMSQQQKRWFLCHGSMGWSCSRYIHAVSERRSLDASREDQGCDRQRH